MSNQCATCRHYVGQIPGSNQVLVCGMHTYGPETTPCPDHEAGSRYTRRLDITYAEDPTTPPAAVVEAERLVEMARAARRRNGWWCSEHYRSWWPRRAR